MTNVAAVAAPGVTLSRSRVVAYWIATALTVAEALAGGFSDLFRLPYVAETLAHLGYPGYLAIILGIWKIPAAVVLLAPRLPRLKEWAYAGMVFDLTGAVASHITVGDGPSVFMAPALITGIVLASWYLRPPSRRL
jgi:uncharacterized membrane protein YphA (DoxX/SURF4 family)